MKHYYIPYNAKANINYIYLLYLYSLAEYNKITKLFDTVNYNSIRDLQKQIKDKFGKDLAVSSSTLARLLKNTDYSNYIKVDQKHKKIALQNDTKGMSAFVMLTNREVDFLLKQQDNLLIKYYLYLKYFCGFDTSKKQDFTAKQFLTYCGYSANSNSYLSKISDYNRILQENNFIKIQPYTDSKGRTRNIYYLLQ